MVSRIRQHLGSNAVGYVALFFSLGLGTAWALAPDSVKSRHIVDNQVKTPDVRDASLPGGGLQSADIAPGAITPAHLSLGAHSSQPAEGSTTSLTPAGLASIGPIVSVDVPADGLVAVYAIVDIKRTGGTICFVHLEEAGLPPSGTAQLLSSNSSSYVTKFTAPGSGASGTTAFADGGWAVFPASPGLHTYTMRYSGLGAGADCSFKNRELSIAAVG
jgi:hypothetical protein